MVCSYNGILLYNKKELMYAKTWMKLTDILMKNLGAVYTGGRNIHCIVSLCKFPEQTKLMCDEKIGMVLSVWEGAGVNLL